MPVHYSVEQRIGNTPLVELRRLAARYRLPCRLLAKWEGANPGGSIKDRVAQAMLDDAEQRGLLRPGGTIIEATSGNTGVGLALMAAVRGYRAVIVMPDNMSRERQDLLRAYGAKIVLTNGTEGMNGAIRKANMLAKETTGAFLPEQFENPANPAVHYRTTGPEIWRDTAGRVDCFIAGVGTGGTITGAGHYLRERNPHIHIVATEPAASPVLSGGKAGPHGLQGLGAGFIPAVLDPGIYDEVIPVTEAEAFAAARELGRMEGILAGISSGAVLHAALLTAKREGMRGKTVVVLLPDRGERYLSSGLFG